MKRLITILMIAAAPLYLKAQSGTLDTGFNGTGMLVDNFTNEDNSADAIAIQPDGKILVAGSTGPGGTSEMAVARYNTDGSPDTSFGTAGKVHFATPFVKSFTNDIKVQPDGKIILGGYQWNNSTGDFVLARLNSDGSLDNGFGTNGISILDSGFSETARSIYLLDDGKILIAGDSDDQFAIAKSNSNGSIDTTFGTNGWVRTSFPIWGYANNIDVSQSGQILLTGMAFDTGGDWKIALAKYDANGDTDTTFGDSGTLLVYAGYDYDFGIRGMFLEDGKLLIGGHSYFGTAPLRYEIAIVRLEADGTIDNTYGTNGFFKFRWAENGENYLTDMALQSDDKLVVTGRSYDGEADLYAIARLTENGQLDSTFGTGGKLSANVDLTADISNAVAIQADGKIVIAGNTFDFENPIQYFIARFLGDSMGVSDLNVSDLKLYPNPASQNIRLEWDGIATSAQIEIFNMAGQKVISTKIENKAEINVSALTQGVYILKAGLNGNSKTLKFIKK